MDWDKYYSKARRAYQADRFIEAETFINEAVRLNRHPKPADEKIALLHAKILDKVGKTDKAVEVLIRSFMYSPDYLSKDAESRYNLLAQFHRKKGDWGAAAQTAFTALQIRPKSQVYYDMLAENALFWCIEKRQFSIIEKWDPFLKKGIELFPLSYDLNRYWGEAEFAAANFAAAAEFCDIARSLRPGDLSAAFVIATALCNTGELSKSYMELKHLVQRGFRHPTLFKVIGKVLDSLGKSDEMEEWIAMAESAAPSAASSETSALNAKSDALLPTTVHDLSDGAAH